MFWAFHQKLDLLRNHFPSAFEGFTQVSTEVMLSKLLQKDLILHPQIQARVNQFKHNNFVRKIVGVHVRYTDHRVRLWAITQRLRMLLKYEPELQIFLSTDNIQIKKMFQQSYPNLQTAPHRYSIPGMYLHGDENASNRMEDGIEALVDLYLLAECDYLLIDTSSSFSYIAKLLARTPQSNIFDLKRGGKLPVRLRSLTWHLMIKLGLFSWGLDIFGKLLRVRQGYYIR